MRKILAGLLAALLGMAAQAGAIHVRPTTVTIGPGQSAANLLLTNEGDTPLTVQVRVFAWEQSQNQDVQTATDKLVASPPMVTLAPGKNQSVRLVRVVKDKPVALEAYRLLIDEVPDTAKVPTVGVAVQMRYALPVFVTPRPAMQPAHLEVTAHVDNDLLTLSARNQGESQAQVANVMAEHGINVRTPVVSGLLGYVLPGRTMQWTLKVPPNIQATGKPARLVLKVNGQDLRIDL